MLWGNKRVDKALRSYPSSWIDYILERCTESIFHYTIVKGHTKTPDKFLITQFYLLCFQMKQLNLETQF